MSEAQAKICRGCGTRLADTLTSCPGCGSLVHRDELERLQQDAKRHEQAGSRAEALVALRRMLELLPEASRQHSAIMERVRALSDQVDNSAPSTPKGSTPKWVAGLGAFGLVLWKLKWLFAGLLGKAKFLLLGLTKLKTLLTMLVSLGAYWTLWGWKFALGAILSMYAHEMGHVAALARFGVPASAPVFVPGLGALVRLKQRLASPVEEARVGIAGPVWGMGASLVCYAIYLTWHAPLFAALAGFGAWLNLFNLVPVWQLDGSRVFAALSRSQRAVAAAVALICALCSGDVIPYAIAIVACVRAFKPSAQEPEGDRVALAEYVFTLLVLTLVLIATQQVREAAGAA